MRALTYYPVLKRIVLHIPQGQEASTNRGFELFHRYEEFELRHILLRDCWEGLNMRGFYMGTEFPRVDAVELPERPGYGREFALFPHVVVNMAKKGDTQPSDPMESAFDWFALVDLIQGLEDVYNYWQFCVEPTQEKIRLTVNRSVLEEPQAV